jgi:hypothetical protein
MYEIIDNLPIDYQFSTKTKEELKLYGTWFNENKDKRIAYLIETVKSTQNFENWNADFTLDSLKQLGNWLNENIETTKLSEEEYKIKREKIADWVEVPDWDLSIRSRSIIVDIGIYFGEVFMHIYPNLKWQQYFSKSKRDINNGHMVIPKFGKMELNPILVMLSVGWGIAKKEIQTNRIFDLFKVWEKYL